MNTWIRTSPADFATQQKVRDQHGLLITLAMSPFDAPEHISGEYDKASSRFVISFGYIGGSEETKEVKIDEHTYAREGARSGRLYSLHVDVDRLKVDSVGLQLQLPEIETRLGEAIRSLKNREANTGTRAAQRSEVNASVIESVRDKFLRDLVTA